MIHVSKIVEKVIKKNIIAYSLQKKSAYEELGVVGGIQSGTAGRGKTIVGKKTEGQKR